MRAIVDVLEAADLLDRALVHHDDPVGDRQRLLLAVGDEDGGDAELLLQRANVLAQPARIRASSADSGWSSGKICGGASARARDTRCC